MIEFYIWNTQTEAQSALDYINGSGWFPIVGRNAKTGELAPEKQQTTSWQLSTIETIDNRWTVQRIPTSILDTIGVEPPARQLFLDTFNPTIETLGVSAFPSVSA